MILRTLWLVALSCLTALRARGAEGDAPPAADPPGKVLERLAGEGLSEPVPQADGSTHYRTGPHLIDTPLPEGYPPPTPPGVVEVKAYPSVRRATFAGRGAGPDGMKNGEQAFWPLFAHIQTRGIAMTSPVETEFEGLKEGAAGGPTAWSMSFLYRSAKLGPKERYGNVVVKDEPPLTVIALGLAGDADLEAIDSGIQRLERTLAEAGRWSRAGEPRTLTYNGPNVTQANRWAEVQLPVAPAPGLQEQGPQGAD